MNKKFFLLKNKKAFTLAEILITLGIIGIVSAMTMPSLIQNYREKQTVTAVKKAYSEFSQAYAMTVQEYDSLANLVDKNKSLKANALTTYQEVTKHMKKVKTCDTDRNCMGESYSSLTGITNTDVGNSNNYNIQSGILADGTSFWILSNFRSNGVYNGQIFVDINGHKRPNRLGVDSFLFGLHGFFVDRDEVSVGELAIEQNRRRFGVLILNLIGGKNDFFSLFHLRSKRRGEF